MNVEQLYKALKDFVGEGKGHHTVVAYCDHGQQPEEISSPSCEYWLPREEELIHPLDAEDYPDAEPCIVLGG